MSYILDALKKSDRERQQETPLHQHLYETSPSFKDGGFSRRRRRSLLPLFGLLLFGGLVIWSGWNQWIGGNRQDPAGEVLPQSTPARTEMAMQQESAGRPSLPAAAGDGKSLSPLTVQEEWFDEWSQHLPKNDFTLPSAESPPPIEGAPQDPSPVVLTANQGKRITKPLKIARDREKVLLAPQDETTVISQMPAVPPVIHQARLVPPVVGPADPGFSVTGQSEPVPTVIRPPEPVLSAGNQTQPVPPVVLQSEPTPSAIEGLPPVPPEKAGRNIPYLRELPPHVQAEMPKLQFAGHAYALNPSQRLIVINGMIMREGDRIDAETRLSEITWEGVVIDRKGVRFQVKCY